MPGKGASARMSVIQEKPAGMRVFVRKDLSSDGSPNVRREIIVFRHCSDCGFYT